MIVESAAESGGERVVADLAVEPDGFIPGGEHVHDHLTEHMEVRTGRITFALDGRERTLTEGEQLTIEPRTWHRFWNADEGELQVRVRVEPAMRFEELILVVWGLCADGYTSADGRPSPLFGALLAARYRREVRFGQPPDAVQRLLFPPLAGLARLRGLERAVDRYLDLDQHPSAQAGLGRLPERATPRDVRRA